MCDPRHELMPNFKSNSYVSLMSRAHATSQVLQGHVKQILGLDFSPNGVNLASGSDDHTVRNDNNDTRAITTSTAATTSTIAAAAATTTATATTIAAIKQR